MLKRRVSPNNFDLFEGREHLLAGAAGTAEELPTEADLNRMFDIYNRQYFDDRLHKVPVRYSRRMLVAGGYFPIQGEIRISEKYHKLFPDEVYDTLKHEMIHLIHFRHNAAFKRLARRVGASVRANDHPELRLPPKFIYVCPVCFAEYPRRRRLRMASCGKCSKHGFDPRYKLVLKKRLPAAARG